MGQERQLPAGTVTFLFSAVAQGREKHERVVSVLTEHGGVEVERDAESVLGAFASPGAAIAAAGELIAGSIAGRRPRVGLHTGEATPDNGGYGGGVVEHAARVGAVAAEGQALVTEATAVLAEPVLRPGERLERLGSRVIPGQTRSETLFELRLGIAALPAHARERPFLERDDELATVLRLAERARGGDGSLAVVEGGAGIGKTRLLAEARIQLGDRMRVLSARGGELEGEFAFGVVRQLFEALLATARPATRSELLSGAAALAEPLFDAPSLADAAGQGETPFAMFHGLYWLAANAAFQQPTVLVIDDLHWADSPSLRWLTYLTRRLDGLPLLVLTAMRPAEQGREPEVLAELLDEPAGVAIRPEPLTTDAVAALVRRRFEQEGDPTRRSRRRCSSRSRRLRCTSRASTASSR